MKCKAVDLGTVSESFTRTLKAYQLETRQQKTDFPVAVNHRTTTSSQLEMAMQEVNEILGCARGGLQTRYRGVSWWLYKGGVTSPGTVGVILVSLFKERRIKTGANANMENLCDQGNRKLVMSE